MSQKRPFGQTINSDAAFADRASSKKPRAISTEPNLQQPPLHHDDSQYRESPPNYYILNTLSNHISSDSSHKNHATTLPGKFACPYYQREPERYRVNEKTGKSRLCSRGGFTDVHRVKEHLYRTHMAPIQCPKCFSKFKSEDQCQAHLRTSLSCTVRDEKYREAGVSPTQKELLKTKARKSKSPSSEVERWKTMYEILFPGELVPSPYFKYTTISAPGDYSHSLDDLARFSMYCKQSLPGRVAVMMQQQIQNNVATSTEEVLNFLPEALDECLSSVLEHYLNQCCTNNLTGSTEYSNETEIPVSCGSTQSTSSLNAWTTISDVPDLDSDCALQSSFAQISLPAVAGNHIGTTTGTIVPFIRDQSVSSNSAMSSPSLLSNDRNTPISSSIETLASLPGAEDYALLKDFLCEEYYRSL